MVVPRTDIENDDNFFGDYGNQKELYIKNLTKRFGDPKVIEDIYIFSTNYVLPKIIYSNSFNLSVERKSSTKYLVGGSTEKGDADIVFWNPITQSGSYFRLKDFLGGKHLL